MTLPAARCATVVGLMGPADHARWDAFVFNCPDASFFHRAGWQTVLERAFGYPSWFLYAEQDGRITGILPLAQVRSLCFGNCLCSLPFCVYGGIAALHDEAAAALDQAARELAIQLKVDHLEYRQRQPRHPERQGRPLYCTFRQALLPTPEQNMLAIPRKQRAMVRKGIAAGLRSHIDSDAGRFHAAYAASVHQLGTPVFGRHYIELLQQVFGADCELMVIEHGGRAVSAVLSFHFAEEVLPYYGGGGAEARTLAANDFMYWEVMRRACEQGRRSFDFGRSKLGTGAFAFKKNWGFTPQALPYEQLLVGTRSMPDKNPLNPRYRMLSAAWRRLPLPLASALGPHLIRQLG
ncbi:FemAB family PEP-CTERM system-associated protein [Oxalobacteraceae bacterium]|nr:FemAB family PEP-CTERM system-associated protein [Oxalobacteraceae bacterium]